jgi:hypothetical protein
MVWGKKPGAPPHIPAPKTPEQSPDQIISEMLSAYQQHFYEKAKGQPDPSIEQAKAKVDRAYQIVSQSRIGNSVCAILEHVKHWPSWSTREDFQKWVGLPATNVSGSREKIERNHDKTTVNFSYSGTPYSLIFIDRGISTWNNDDMTAYGTVELQSAQQRLAGFFRRLGTAIKEPDHCHHVDGQCGVGRHRVGELVAVEQIGKRASA